MSKYRQLEKVPIIAMYCHLRPPDAIAFPTLTSFGGFKSELQTNPMPFHLQLLWVAMMMLIRGCALDWDGTK